MWLISILSFLLYATATVDVSNITSSLYMKMVSNDTLLKKNKTYIVDQFKAFTIKYPPNLSISYRSNRTYKYFWIKYFKV
jgi:hypothetical protein